MIVNEKQVPGLYIHIPFCKTKCGYCDFYSATDTVLITEYLNALFNEIESYREEFTRFDTVYLGGGTPSLLTCKQIEALLEKVRKTFKILPASEITIEVNPADLGRNDLSDLHDMGINRINIGVQSFDDSELAFLGRRHNSLQAMNTLGASRLAGFDNIGLDLIYSLPGQRFEKWKVSLAKALAFAPDHLSCYELELKARTPLGLRYGQNKPGPRTEERHRKFFMKTSEILERSGYLHYEISNFALRMNKASRHNQKYWEHTPYLGLGPSAHSFENKRRWWNHESLHDYIHDLKEGKRPVSNSEELGNEELAMETLFLGLRMRKGIDLKEYERRYGHNLMKEKDRQFQEWVKAGLIEIEGCIIRPTRAGMAVADGLALL